MRSFLNLTSFNPHMARGVCGMLAELGGAASEEHLRAWLAPLPPFPNAKAREDGGLPVALDVVIELGLADRKDGMLTLAPDTPVGATAFASAIRAKVLERAATFPHGSNTSTDDPDDPTDELVGALA